MTASVPPFRRRWPSSPTIPAGPSCSSGSASVSGPACRPTSSVASSTSAARPSPALAAKPVIDMLVEVTSLERTRTEVVPVLTVEGYDYFWRPTFGDDTPPWYAWFIKRDEAGVRTHHIHMVEADFPHWERLLFRDFLIEHPEVAAEYAEPEGAPCGRAPERPRQVHGREDGVHRIGHGLGCVPGGEVESRFLAEGSWRGCSSGRRGS